MAHEACRPGEEKKDSRILWRGHYNQGLDDDMLVNQEHTLAQLYLKKHLRALEEYIIERLDTGQNWGVQCCLVNSLEWECRNLDEGGCRLSAELVFYHSFILHAHGPLLPINIDFYRKSDADLQI